MSQVPKTKGHFDSLISNLGALAGGRKRTQAKRIAVNLIPEKRHDERERTNKVDITEEVNERRTS